jgi:LPXTG-motif cell wall-anchored protein
MRILSISLVLCVILTVIAVGNAFAQSSVTVQLNEINGSGVSGTATLTPKGTQTQIDVHVVGEPAGGSEPIHVHTGNCGAALGPIKYPLQSVENGTSSTVIDAPLESIETGHFAVNVHQSAANIGTYVACGNIPAIATTSSLPKTGGTPFAALAFVGGVLAAIGLGIRRWRAA